MIEINLNQTLTGWYLSTSVKTEFYNSKTKKFEYEKVFVSNSDLIKEITKLVELTTKIVVEKEFKSK